MNTYVHHLLGIKLVLFVMLLCIPSILFAKKYRIIFLNTNSIKIGNRFLHEQDVFNDNEEIHWTDLRQKMEVENVNNPSEQHTLTKHGFLEYKDEGVKSLLDLIKVQSLGTRDMNGGQKHYSEIYHYLTDTLMFPTTTRVDPSIRCEAVWIKGKKEIVTPVKRSQDGRFYIISLDIYKGKKPCDINLDIREVNEQIKWVNNVYKGIPIVYIPKRL